MRFFALVSLFIVMGCSTTPTVHVLPGENGLNRAMSRGVSKEAAEQAAFGNAKNYCASRGEEIEFIGSTTDYTGTMDESTRDLIRTTTQVTMAGAAITAVTDEDRRDVASSVAAASAAGYASTMNRDYQTSVSFRCISNSSTPAPAQKEDSWLFW